jgi:hypothetical protein
MSDLRHVYFSEVRERLVGNRLAVYEALTMRGPSTGSELARVLSWEVTSVRPRVVELEKMFHAVPTGQRRENEHEFRALTTAEAMQLHEAERHKYAIEHRALERERVSEAAAILAGARRGRVETVNQSEFVLA